MTCLKNGHDFRINNGGICINWTGAIGTYTCTKCLATAKYGYNKAGDQVRTLWIKDLEGNYSSTNQEAIEEFGNCDDWEAIGIK